MLVHAEGVCRMAPANIALQFSSTFNNSQEGQAYRRPTFLCFIQSRTRPVPHSGIQFATVCVPDFPRCPFHFQCTGQGRWWWLGFCIGPR